MEAKSGGKAALRIRAAGRSPACLVLRLIIVTVIVIVIVTVIVTITVLVTVNVTVTVIVTVVHCQPLMLMLMCCRVIVICM